MKISCLEFMKKNILDDEDNLKEERHIYHVACFC